MAVLKNKTQKNFTMISNNILRDKSLSMKDCGVLCTLCSLPDGWEFSIVGLSATVPDGVDSIRKSITNLEELGYMNRTKSRGSDGKYISEIEVFRADGIVRGKVPTKYFVKRFYGVEDTCEIPQEEGKEWFHA